MVRIMYSASSPGLQRSDEDDRHRRDSNIAVNTQQLPSFNARSPTHIVPYSPTNGTHPQSPYNQYSSRSSTSATVNMPTGISPRLGPPPSPKFGGPTHNSSAYSSRDSGNTTYYDPTSEHREGQATWSNSQHPTNSPVQVSHTKEPNFLCAPHVVGNISG